MSDGAKARWINDFRLLTLAIVCSVSVFACLFLYTFDNKYTANGPRASSGELVLSASALVGQPVLFLTEGWEYFGRRLLSPADFGADAPAPDEYIYIGQYGGFEAGSLGENPHGSATYRLTIRIPQTPETYMLELPEIFSAYRAYINGKLVQSMGYPDPDNYVPETGNRAAVFEAGGRIEIIIAVSDFSHIYSGMVFPPAFGKPEAVTALLNTRLIFRSVFVAFALAVGALALLIGVISRRKSIALLYGLLCLFFVGYTSYPILQTLFSAIYPFYAIENISFCAMLAVVMLLQKSLFGRRDKWNRCIIGVGAFMCLASAVLPFAVTGGSLAVMGIYSYLIMSYQWGTSVYLTVTAVKAVAGGKTHSTALLAGVLAFDTALVMDRLLPLHEPIVSGWFPELASFALTICIGAVVTGELAGKYRDSAVLEERMSGMERLSEMQRSNYDMLRERIEEARTIRHDMRHHVIMVEGFLRDKDYEKLEAYVREYRGAVELRQPLSFSQNLVVNVLAGHYSGLAEKNGIDISFSLDIGSECGIPEADLCSVVSNLLENGIEACGRLEGGGRFISLTISQKPSMLSIIMRNSASDVITGRNGAFISSKADERSGYGLDSIRAVAARSGGFAEFSYDWEKGVFISSVLLAVNREMTLDR